MTKRVPSPDKGGAWVLRDISRDTMRRTKIAAAIEGKSIKAFIMDLVENHLAELERKGTLPRGKG